MEQKSFLVVLLLIIGRHLFYFRPVSKATAVRLPVLSIERWIERLKVVAIMIGLDTLLKKNSVCYKKSLKVQFHSLIFYLGRGSFYFFDDVLRKKDDVGSCV